MADTTSDGSQSQPRIRWLRRWLMVACLLLPAIFGGAWIWQGFQAEQHRNLCRSHLQQIGISLHQYHDTYGSFPPAYVKGPDGEPWHSWRVLLLPDLGYEELYARYRFDQPWDGPVNRQLADEVPTVYQCPACTDSSFLHGVGRFSRSSKSLCRPLACLF